MKSVIASRPWTKDPYTIRKAWDEEAYRLSEHGGPGAKLCFGIMWHNGALLPHPPVTRGLKITKDALIASGHTVIDWEPLMIQEIQDMVVSLIMKSGIGSILTIFRVLSGKLARTRTTITLCLYPASLSSPTWHRTRSTRSKSQRRVLRPTRCGNYTRRSSRYVKHTLKPGMRLLRRPRLDVPSMLSSYPMELALRCRMARTGQ
jgi:hypothetical protein